MQFDADADIYLDI